MAEKTRYSYKKIIRAIVWLLFGTGVVVLLIAAMNKNDEGTFSGINVKVKGAGEKHFIQKEDILRILEGIHKKKLENTPISSIDITAMEDAIKKEKWVDNVEIYFDNNNVLQVSLKERIPVARVFTNSGNSFYIDDALMRLPSGNKYSERLPVFTNFPTDVIVLNQKDSALLKEIKTMGEFIAGDPFWMAQIDQIDITPSRKFELIPKLGNQVIRFGSADNCADKFNNLMAFYKQVQTRTGWNRYSILDVQFKGQVVAIQRDAKEVKADSIRAVQVMKEIIAESLRKMNDSSNVQLVSHDDPININESSERDNMTEGEAPGKEEVRTPATPVTPVAAPKSPVVKKEIKKPAVAVPVKKPEPKKPTPANVVEKKPAPKPAVKKVEEKKVEVKKTTTKPAEKPTPKAIMPPKKGN